MFACSIAPDIFRRLDFLNKLPCPSATLLFGLAFCFPRFLSPEALAKPAKRSSSARSVLRARRRARTSSRSRRASGSARLLASTCAALVLVVLLDLRSRAEIRDKLFLRCLATCKLRGRRDPSRHVSHADAGCRRRFHPDRESGCRFWSNLRCSSPFSAARNS